MPAAVVPAGLVREDTLAESFYNLVLEPPLLTLTQRLPQMHLLPFHL